MKKQVFALFALVLSLTASIANADLRYSSVVRNADGSVTINDLGYQMPDGTIRMIKLAESGFDEKTYRPLRFYTDGARAICRIVAHLPNPSAGVLSNSVFVRQVVLDKNAHFARNTWENFVAGENAYTSDTLNCTR